MLKIPNYCYPFYCDIPPYFGHWRHYKLTDNQLNELKDIYNNNIWIAVKELLGITKMDSIHRFWQNVANKQGFDWTTPYKSNRSGNWFIAKPII